MKLPTDLKADITLHLKEFLQETEHELWTLLELDKALIKKHPGISKKQAHGKVKNDLVVLKKLYPEDKHILNQLKSVEKEFKSEKKNIALGTLWNKCKDSLDANEIELYSKRQELITESLGLANNEISQLSKKRPRLLPHHPRLHKQHILPKETVSKQGQAK
ncbi:unnamed protein product [Rhizopus stolonifer]